MNLAETNLLVRDLSFLSDTALDKFYADPLYVNRNNYLSSASASFTSSSNKKNILPFPPILKNVGRRGRHVFFNFTTFTLILRMAYKTVIKISKKLHRLDKGIKDACVSMVFNSLKQDRIFLFFEDPLSCGLISSYPAGKTPAEFSYLGLDILDPSFNGDYLISELTKYRSVKDKKYIKSFLMDSSIIAWLDNEFASEALFVSGISPYLRIDVGENIAKIALTMDIIANALKAVYERAVDHLMNTTCSLEKIPFNKIYSVYGREGERCVGCGHKIRRSTIDGLPTFWCSNCQLLKEAAHV